jgi:hypothetical protein
VPLLVCVDCLFLRSPSRVPYRTQRHGLQSRVCVYLLSAVCVLLLQDLVQSSWKCPEHPFAASGQAGQCQGAMWKGLCVRLLVAVSLLQVHIVACWPCYRKLGWGKSASSSLMIIVQSCSLFLLLCKLPRGAARTILLFHNISASPSKQLRMVGSTLGEDT